MWTSPSTLLAVFTKREYTRVAALQNILACESEKDHLPSYETLRTGIFPFLMNHIVPGAKLVKVLSKTPDQVGIDPTSVWAMMDISDLVFMYSLHSFNRTPFNTERFISLDNESVFDVMDKLTSMRHRVGDHVQVTVDENRFA